MKYIHERCNTQAAGEYYVTETITALRVHHTIHSGCQSHALQVYHIYIYLHK